MGTLGSAVRFYATDNLGRICHRWSEAREEEVDEDAFKRVMALLQSAAMDSREEFTGRWATLLQSMAEDEEGSATFPSFGTTLSQISPLEATLLERLWQQVISGEIDYSLEAIALEGKFTDWIQTQIYERHQQQVNSNDHLEHFSKARGCVGPYRRCVRFVESNIAAKTPDPRHQGCG